MNILLLENIQAQAKNKLESKGFNVSTLPGSLTENELIEAIKDVHILGIRSKTTVNETILNHENAKNLLAIGAFCIGTNQVDLKSAMHKGICVFNAPYSNTRSVVELAIGEMICLLRDIPAKNELMHKGTWQKSAQSAHEIRSKVLGIIGYGNIGSQLSVLAESLGLRVQYYDIIEKLPLGNAKVCKTLDELLETSDIISIHIDGREANQNFIDDLAIQKMKNGVILLNLSRGHVLDLNAVETALKSNKISGCAIDVFEDEPLNNTDKFIHPLCRYSNVILTPHIGGSTIEAQEHIADFVSSRLIDYIENGTTQLSVNFPNLSLPTRKDLHRIIHIHENRPGLLAKINAIFAANEINIESQHLKTFEDIGYVISDINGNDYKQSNTLDKLNEIKGTIKVRILY